MSRFAENLLLRFQRPPHPLPEQMVLGTRQIYILPNRHGLLFAAVLLTLALAAINYNNSFAFLLTFLLTSMAVVSLLHSQRNLLNLQVTAVGGEPVFAGDAASVRICVHNPDMARYALQLETRAGVMANFDVPANDTHCVRLAVTSVQRGWLDCPPFTLVSTYPLGITRTWSWRMNMPARTLVYPRPADDSGVSTLAALEGESRPGVMLEGEDFSGLRGYQPGDALSRISWKTLARGQGLHTKQFTAPQAESVWLDWDAFAPLAVEERLSRMCRAVLDAQDQGLSYGLRLPGRTLDPDSGTAHRHRCLEALALHELPT